MFVNSNLFIEPVARSSAKLLMVGNTENIWKADGTVAADAYINTVGLAAINGVQPHRICIMQAASNVDSDGHRQIKSWEQTNSQNSIVADGIYVSEFGTMTAFQTADCLALAIFNAKTGVSIILHCGRPAGMPVDGRNIIDDALILIAKDSDMSHIHIVGIGSISGKCFEHQTGQAADQAREYLKMYGEEVFADTDRLALDMRAMARLVATNAGVKSENITFVGPDCTKCAPCCASHREHLVASKPRLHANTIVLVT